MVFHVVGSPTSSVREFKFLIILANTYVVSLLHFTHSCRSEVVYFVGFN